MRLLRSFHSMYNIFELRLGITFFELQLYVSRFHRYGGIA